MPLAPKSPGSQPRQIPRREQTRINIFECLRDAPTSGLATRLAQLNPSEIQGPAKTTTVGLKPCVVCYRSGQGPTSRSQLQVRARGYTAPTKKLHLPHDHPRHHKNGDQCPTQCLTGDKVDVPIHLAPITIWPRHRRRRLGRCHLLRNRRDRSPARYLAGNKPGSIILSVCERHSNISFGHTFRQKQPLSGSSQVGLNHFKVPLQGPSSRSHSPNTKKLHLYPMTIQGATGVEVGDTVACGSCKKWRSMSHGTLDR